MGNNRSAFRLMAYLYFAYSTMTIIISYMPVYFQHHGLSGIEVGWLLAVGPFASIFAQPFWAYMSDKYKTIKRVLVVTLIGVLAAAVALFQMNSFIGFMIMMFVLFSFMSPITALGDSLAQKTAQQMQGNFGRIRMWGSLGFAITSLLTGYFLAFFGIEYLWIPFLCVAFVALIMALTVSDVKSTAKPVTLLSAVKLGIHPKLLLFLLIILFVSITHRTNDSFLGIYIVELGGSESLIGLAWFIGVTSEALVLATSAYWFRRFHPLTFILVAGLIYSSRWFLMGMIHDPTFTLVLQVLHGVSFGVFYICAFQFVSKLIPDHLQATGHILFITTFFGLSGIIGSLGGGWVIEEMGVTTLYLILAGFALVGSIGILIYKVVSTRMDGKKLVQNQ
ncbi:MFS transporter [Desertibacillus haloalkaliphilus]|uniref:MFS transporter n=1 Tax=Desertibacillus haloalkaliphilus TaxID=1328930 RepID=UPI001C275073|nr:MFS transporter [Desertibacillus haloalkaliphilus]MBU8907447.1 MFS transporter [Desertibacillus haloalkaliphilus]